MSRVGALQRQSDQLRNVTIWIDVAALADMLGAGRPRLYSDASIHSLLGNITVFYGRLPTRSYTTNCRLWPTASHPLGGRQHWWEVL